MSRLLLTLFVVQCVVNFSLVAALAKKETRSVPQELPLGAPSDVEDKYEPYYRSLAEASLQEYQRRSGSAPLRLWSVDRVTEQVVEGSLFRIDFNARDDEGGALVHCHAKIWQHYSKHVEIGDVDCHKIIMKIGSETEVDPAGTTIRELAEKALQKYTEDSGNDGYFITRVEKATFAPTSPPRNSVVLTAINSVSNVIHCNAKIIFLYKRDPEIQVGCEKSKRKYYSQ